MTKQIHVVSTDALGTLGTIIDETAGRDAIHLAVEPVMAGEKLYPGSHVRMKDGKAEAGGETVGIVDPFLKGPVYEGQWFWFVIYPRAITSLRHVWSHPAFADVSAAPVEPAIDTKSDSEKWMRAWAVKHMSDDYYSDDYGAKRSEESAYASALEAGEDNHVGPYEDARDHIDSEWWDYWEAITGKKGNREDWFSCGC